MIELEAIGVCGRCGRWQYEDDEYAIKFRVLVQPLGHELNLPKGSLILQTSRGEKHGELLLCINCQEEELADRRFE